MKEALISKEKLSKLNQLIEQVLRCLRIELRNIEISCFERFPHGCCDIASCILLRILRKENYFQFRLVRGTNSENLHHVWLESEQLIIDLTSEQFKGFTHPFILVDSNEYPLKNQPYYSNLEFSNIDDNWPYLENLAPEFMDIFYKKYYQ